MKKTLLFCLIPAFVLFSCHEPEPLIVEAPIVEVPTLSTENVISITSVSARSGGLIVGDGGFDITQRGVCWSTDANPTTSDSLTLDGAGIGYYESQIVGLERGTEYFVRAYAVNSKGTSYGEDISFRTEAEFPILSTTKVEFVSYESAKSGGMISDNGGDAITQRGVCWSTKPTPTIADNKTEDGTGSGSYESQISGLEKDSLYYVRAYAINSKGVNYGQERAFLSELDEGAFVDARDNNTYKWIKMGANVWFAENLNVSAATLNARDASRTVAMSDWKDTCVWENKDHAYGKLYSWEAAKLACPAGWHLPSDDEWKLLTDCVIENGVVSGEEGTALKSTSRWYADGNGTDAYKFNALPAGRVDYGTVRYQGNLASWWCIVNDRTTSPAYTELYHNSTILSHKNALAIYGMSVRCVRD